MNTLKYYVLLLCRGGGWGETFAISKWNVIECGLKPKKGNGKSFYILRIFYKFIIIHFINSCFQYKDITLNKIPTKRFTTI